MVERYLVRHGQSASQIGESASEPREIPLTPLGKRQAVRVAEEIFSRGIELERIATSPNKRALDTSKPTRQRYPAASYGDWHYAYELDFLGRFHGILSNLSDRAATVEEFWERADPAYRDGAETFDEFVSRGEKLLEQLHSSEQTIVVFSHEMLMDLLRWLLVNEHPTITSASMRDYRNFMLENRIKNCALIAVNPEKKLWHELYAPPQRLEDFETTYSEQ